MDTPTTDVPTNQNDQATGPLKTVKPTEKCDDGIKVTGANGSAALQYGDVGKKQRKQPTGAAALLNIFLPNRAISGAMMKILILIEAALALLVWINSPFKVLPTPMEVVQALQRLWLHEGLGQELGNSFMLNLRALALSTLISLGLSYLTVLPVFRPLVAAASKGRFLSMVGFTLVFTLMVGGGRPMQVAMLTFAMTVFYITSMASVIAVIPRAEMDHARTLRMGEWRVVGEIVVLGTLDKAFEVLRQNAAIGWMMLTMVEGVVRSEGGIGVMLLNASKHFMLADVFAIQLLILLVGMGQDYAIGVLRRMVCPYADLTLERK